MKLYKNLFHSVLNLRKYLPSTMATLPKITITGTKEVSIEQEYKLLSFSDKNIELQCEDGIIRISGNSFIIKYMYPYELILEGEIEEVSFRKVIIDP